MIPEEDISDAIARGDRQAVRAWLNAKDSDVNSRSVDGPTLLGKCVMAAAESRSKYEARNHLEIGRLLVARGARATKLGKARLLRAPLKRQASNVRQEAVHPQHEQPGLHGRRRWLLPRRRLQAPPKCQVLSHARSLRCSGSSLGVGEGPRAGRVTDGGRSCHF